MKSQYVGISIFGVGLAVVAGYLNVNNISASFLWAGVFFCFITVLE